MKTRGGKALRTGWTTGTCSAAAAKAATLALIAGAPVARVEVALPGKDGGWTQRVAFPVQRCEELKPGTWQAVVVKDAGDDPDVTHGAHLTATVSWREGAAGIELEGGEGVGVVTKPGLGLEVGGPAINPVPRAMIERAVSEALNVINRPVEVEPDQEQSQEQQHSEGVGEQEARAISVMSTASAVDAVQALRVVISVPGGEIMARKTTNRRLGIIGGISILGTTGIVRPFSTASWRASVEQAVAVLGAQAAGSGMPLPLPPLVLCTGGRTEKGAMALLPDLPEMCFVEVGDFTGAALRKAIEHGVRDVAFVGMIGKLTKLAGGVLMTHYTRSAVDTDVLADITRRAIGDDALAERVRAANTARHAYEVWHEAGVLGACGKALCDQVADVLERFAQRQISARVALVDFTGTHVVAASTTWATS
ncbi:cobalt-precorrin-5B (C(1))-methyltransferase [Actinocrinis sp.]|uniref:cobalt-precorrin-5B (C(1))-methyltransferase n=1 Tax=Actinocrinis sp. TaxID=1920516 RepID=UPI0032C24400